MAKPNKNAIKEKLDEWATARVKADRVEAQRDKALEPLTTNYNRKCAAIHEEANEKLRPLQEMLNNLETEIAKEFCFGIDRAKKTVALYQVANERAIAEVQTGEGNREIPPEKFFDQTPSAQRDSRFWECVKIQIGKAEKFLGSVVDSIAEKPWTADVTVKLKE